MDNLKRDLVSLLGTLSFYRSLPTSTEKEKESESVRIVQDTTREKGGLFDVMNLTQLDERNPCESLVYSHSSIEKGANCDGRTDQIFGRGPSLRFATSCGTMRNRRISSLDLDRWKQTAHRSREETLPHVF